MERIPKALEIAEIVATSVVMTYVIYKMISKVIE